MFYRSFRPLVWILILFFFFHRGKSLALLLFESKVRFARNLERSQFVSKFAKDWISFYRVNGIFVFYRGKEFYFSARADFFFFFFFCLFSMFKRKASNRIGERFLKKIEKIFEFREGWKYLNWKIIIIFQLFGKNLCYMISLIQSEIYFKSMYVMIPTFDFYFQSESFQYHLNIRKLKNPQWSLRITNLSISIRLSRIDIRVNSIKNRHLIDTGI